MAKLEICKECQVSFKHHELVAHRRMSGHYKYPLANVAIKEELHNSKRERIEAKQVQS